MRAGAMVLLVLLAATGRAAALHYLVFGGVSANGMIERATLAVRALATLDVRDADNCTATYFPSIIADAPGRHRMLFKRYDFARGHDMPWIVGELDRATLAWHAEDGGGGAWPTGADVRVLAAPAAPHPRCHPLHVMHVGGARSGPVRVHIWDAEGGGRPLAIEGRAFVQHWEKNWAPFVHATLPCEYTYFLYSIDPLAVLLCARASGHCRIVQGSVTPRAGVLRGGTPLVRHPAAPGFLIGLAHSTYVAPKLPAHSGKNGVHRPFVYVVEEAVAGTFRLVYVAGPRDFTKIAPPVPRTCRAVEERTPAADGPADIHGRLLFDTLVQDPVSLVLLNDSGGDCAVVTLSVQPHNKVDSFGVLTTVCGLVRIVDRAREDARLRAAAPDWQRFVGAQIDEWLRTFTPRQL